MFAIRARRKVATERDFLDAVEKVVRQGTKFSSTYAQSPPSSYHNPATNIGFTGPCIKCITRLVAVSRMSYILSLCYRTFGLRDSLRGLSSWRLPSIFSSATGLGAGRVSDG